MFNCMWFCIVTMCTVGYGDYFPVTHLGRTVTLVICIWGVFIVSIMVVTLTNTLIQSNFEKKAIAVLEKLDLRD
jgi:hypothetical protein